MSETKKQRIAVINARGDKTLNKDSGDTRSERRSETVVIAKMKISGLRLE